MSKPKILFYDIETRPLEAYVWGLGDQHISIDNLKEDWAIIAFAAKWHGSNTIIYEDLRNANNINDDKALVKKLWVLLDEADIVITQNGVNFDNKKANARFHFHGLGKPSAYANIDTLKINRKNFSFTSNKLAYITANFNTKYKKSLHGKFPGMTLWIECLKGNLEAWREMKNYNIHDVLSLEEYYEGVKGWDSSVDRSTGDEKCRVCDSNSLEKRGFHRTASGKFQRYQCRECGAWMKDSKSLATHSGKRAI